MNNVSILWDQSYKDKYSMDNNEKYPVENVIINDDTFADSDSDISLCEKRTSWNNETPIVLQQKQQLLEAIADSTDADENEQRFRQELIQRATTRLRCRQLENGIQQVLHEIASLQAQLETLRMDTVTSMDTISNLPLDDDKKSFEEMCKINRQMDVLERRLHSHKSGLNQFTIVEHNESGQQNITAAAFMEKTDSSATDSTALSRLSSLSLVSSIFGRRASTTESQATSISSPMMQSEKQQQHDDSESFIDDDCVSQISSIHGGVSVTSSDSSVTSMEEEEDYPFYDLAGKRSFRAGSFCGSVYHEQPTEDDLLPTPSGNSAEIRWRRRQRRQRHQQQLQQQQQKRYHSSDEDISDDISATSSLSSIAYQSQHQFSLQENFTQATTPLPNCHGNRSIFFDQQQHSDCNSIGKQNETNSMEYWLNRDPYCYQQQNHLQRHPQQQQQDDNDNDCVGDGEHDESYWTQNNSQLLYPLQRNILDDALSFLDGLSENGDDGGFREDMYLLLENPDLCCRPFTEIEPVMHQLRQQQHRQDTTAAEKLAVLMNLLKPTTWCQLGVKYSTEFLFKMTCSSLQWCKFLSVLAAAVVISILKGPEDMHRYSLKNCSAF